MQWRQIGSHSSIAILQVWIWIAWPLHDEWVARRCGSCLNACISCNEFSAWEYECNHARSDHTVQLMPLDQRRSPLPIPVNIEHGGPLPRSPPSAQYRAQVNSWIYLCSLQVQALIPQGHDMAMGNNLEASCPKPAIMLLHSTEGVKIRRAHDRDRRCPVADCPPED